jgi:hypothetical protein
VETQPAKEYPVKLCKAGEVDPKLSFSFAVTRDGSAVSGSPFTLATGRCVLVGSFPAGTALSIAETPAAGTTLKAVLGSPAGIVTGVQGTTAAVKVAAAEVNKVVFVNVVAKPKPVCTYSKGFYKSTKGAALIDQLLGTAGLVLPAGMTVDGAAATTLTTAQVHAVFDTSESELGPGSGAPFNLLQQTVAALLNVERGATASASVMAAIQTALAGLSVEFDGGRVADISATKSALGALDTIEAFNADPATHCD